MQLTPDLDLTAVVVCRDDEEVVGHRIRRLHAHLRSLGLRAEILAVDEQSGDNTLAILGILRHELPELRIVCGAQPGRGFQRGTELARGQALLLLDARTKAPLSALGFALGRLDGDGARGVDAFAVSGRYLVLRRTRALAALDALVHRRDADDLELRFLRRAEKLRLRVHVAAGRAARPGSLRRLRDALLVPLAARAWW